ncbi:MAG: nuclear transport factor 2 family protein [Sedimentisphaerales bacterium]|nr:nuclear transport factor 2 family protein [Sedimentisphaerales bacterium]
MNKPAKSKLQKDMQLYRYSFYSTIACVIGLVVLKLIQMSMDIDEQEFYLRYSSGRYLVLFFSFLFMASLVYTVKKQFDTNPSIQLRRKSLDELKKIYNDPDYAKWHYMARSQLIRKNALVKKDDYSLSEKEKLDLINKYFDSFNSVDIDGMVSTAHQDIVVTHFFAKKTASSTFGSEEFRAYMEKASLEDNELTQSRKETVQDITPLEDKVIVHTTYEAILAIDFPKGPKKGETLKQNWEIEFVFREGKIYTIIYNKTN